MTLINKKERSSKEDFSRDKKIGEEFEDYVKQVFKDNDILVTDRDDVKSKFDFYAQEKGSKEAPKRVEVKFDKRSNTSGNYGFEMFYRGSTSGVNEHHLHDWWVQGTEEEFYVYNSAELNKELHKLLGTSKCKFYPIFGEGSSGAVIKKENITQLAIMEFRNGKKTTR